MTEKLFPDPAYLRFVGKTCLITSSNGQIRAGKFMGLSTMGTKDFVSFITTSGQEMLVNVSYLESVEVLNACDQEEHDHRGQVGTLVVR
jgi:hypothetical protein